MADTVVIPVERFLLDFKVQVQSTFRISGAKTNSRLILNIMTNGLGGSFTISNSIICDIQACSQ